jgi:lipopolysaccharide export system protein LptC
MGLEARSRGLRAAAMGSSLTVATHTAGAETHAWSASGRRDLARLMRVARRHSGRVRFLRRAIPAGSAVVVALFVFFTVFNPLRAVRELPIDPGKLVVSGTKITMEAPKIQGFTRDNRAYNMTADAASQDLTNPTMLELYGVRARIEMQRNAIVDVTAVGGLYDTKTELLTLTQYVHIISSDGYEGHLTEAAIDVRKGLIVSERPVEVNLPNGKLNAKRMEVVDNGALMRFDGGITLVLTGEPGGADRKGAEPGGADRKRAEAGGADRKGSRR